MTANAGRRGKLGMVPWDFGWELPPINLIRRRREQALRKPAVRDHPRPLAVQHPVAQVVQRHRRRGA
ncbi:hypothetical protein FGX01_02970, partial [Xylella fastidiosa subsp. multiplex]|nr:hypothetical protein [Xylella fastidiosa subsp. multiplex]